MSTPSKAEPVPSKSFREFLESTPPEVSEYVSGLFQGPLLPSGSRRWSVSSPDLLLHCSSDECNGFRLFNRASSTVEVNRGNWTCGFFVYKCKNCGQGTKTYTLMVLFDGREEGQVYKFGELPVYGPPIPARVITLIGPDRDHFLLGRRAENHGLGIGAFAYYRRVVENQKGRIIKEIAKVAKKLGAAPEILQGFEKAATETQFKTAIDDIKAGLPSVLMIEGHNPLTLLHTALSEGLHEEDDKSCLELAQSIRTVLTELAERMSSVLKDQQELHSAVSKLLNRKAGQAPPATTPPEEG
jgi:hypothetical protein